MNPSRICRLASATSSTARIPSIRLRYAKIRAPENGRLVVVGRITPDERATLQDIAKKHNLQLVRHEKAPKNTTPINDRPPPESSIRTMISLHHAAASFMHSPEEAGTGFINAFRNTPEPTFVQYEQWRDQVVSSQDSDRFVSNNPFDMDQVDSPYLGQVYWQTFKEHDTLFRDEEASLGKVLMEREREVKEKLFGTWERGGLGMQESRPGLEGVLEYLAVKRMSVEDCAEEWNGKSELKTAALAAPVTRAIEQPKKGKKPLMIRSPA